MISEVLDALIGKNSIVQETSMWLLAGKLANMGTAINMYVHAPPVAVPRKGRKCFAIRASEPIPQRATALNAPTNPESDKSNSLIVI